MINGNIITPFGGLRAFGGNTARVQAYIDASGLDDDTIIGAMNVLDQVIIDNSFGAEFKFLYLFVGGTAALHKWNFMDPRDLDAAYRLTFNGTAVHDANGWKPNGANGWADTYLPSTSLAQNDMHLSIFTNDTSGPSGTEIGEETIGSKRSKISLSIGGPGYWSVNSGTENILGVVDKNAYYWANRNSSTTGQFYKNGTEIDTSTATSVIMSGDNFYLGARNQGNTASLFSNRRLATVTSGKSFSAANQAIWNTALNVFNTSLSRGN